MKKTTVLLLCVFLLGAICLPVFAACTPRSKTLRIYTCEDYLSMGGDADVKLDKEFEKYYEQVTGEKVKVKVETYTDNEAMYTMIAAKRSDYDIVVPSDYMVEKMIENNLLIELESNLGNDVNGNPIEDYRGNVAPFAEQFARENYDKDYKYSRTYMWGTLGVIFNPALLKEQHRIDADENGYPDFVQSWDCLFNNNDSYYKDSISLKNSMRDTVAIASIQAKKKSFTTVNDYAIRQLNDKLALRDALNATDTDSIDAVKNVITTTTAREVFKGFDDEEAKQWILDGDIKLALQWQGDAYGCIMEDETLDYYVPDEGSNIFFDAWCIPKYAKNTKAAQLWINFMCKSSSAIANMEYIGYTSAIGTSEVMDWCNKTYADYDAIDLSYFFGEAGVEVHADPRQFLPASVIARCEMMKNYGEEAEKRITIMWNEAKA